MSIFYPQVSKAVFESEHPGPTGEADTTRFCAHTRNRTIAHAHTLLHAIICTISVTCKYYHENISENIFSIILMKTTIGDFDILSGSRGIRENEPKHKRKN